MVAKDHNSEAGEPTLALGKSAPRTANTSNQLRPTAAVVVALRLTWRARVGDYRMNTALAEDWEGDFPQWSLMGDRGYQLLDPAIDYGVRLQDGAAQFRLERLASLDRLTHHVASVVGILESSGRLPASVEANIKFLHAVSDQSFPDLVQSLWKKLLGEQILHGLAAEAEDFSYLVDLKHEGNWYQLNLGAVRAYEIPQRTGVTLDKIPDLAVFWGLATRRKVTGTGFDAGDLVKDLLQMGDDVLTEVRT